MQRLLLLIIIFTNIFSFEMVNAQHYENKAVKISSEKVRVNNKLYYSHKVLERQTLYSISKAYNVDLDDIYQANPIIKKEGLRPNKIIFIPINSLKSRESREVPECVEGTESAESKEVTNNEGVSNSEVDDTTGYILQSGVSNSEEVAKNIDSTESGDSEESEENIKRFNKYVKERIDIEYITHIVKWFEDIERIAEKYGSSVDIIMEINNLQTKKLRRKQKLLIPYDTNFYLTKRKLLKDNWEEGSDINNEMTDDNIEEGIIVDEATGKVTKIAYKSKNKICAALIMPFKSNSIVGGTPSIMDFYSGTLLAAKEIGENGINLDLDVFDISSDSLILSDINYKNYDFIIGPVSLTEINSVLKTKPSGCKIISPLDHKISDLISTEPDLIQVPTAIEYQFTDLTNWISKISNPSDDIIILSEDNHRINPLKTEFKSRLDSAKIPYKEFSYSILEGRNILSNLRNFINNKKHSNIYIASNDDAFITDAIRNMNLLIHKDYSLSIFASSRTKSFKAMEVDSYHDTNLHLSQHYYIDYDTKEVQNFILKYRSLFQTEPTPFAFQGYDILYYFSKMASTYGDKWPYFLKINKRSQLQIVFDFQKLDTENSGFYNIGTHRLEYKDNYIIEEAKQ